MFEPVVYELNLYLRGSLIGDIREIAENLTWTRRRTKLGADQIDFTLNDVLFDRWCAARGVTIRDMLYPLALECRVVRNGVPVVGGFLATMPAYSPRGTSANLAMRFDGYLNLLAGFLIYNRATGLPLGTQTKPAHTMLNDFISEANSVSASAGRSFGFKAGTIKTLPVITNSFNTFKPLKSFICDRCDNTTGAGPFDIVFDADKTYNILPNSDFGETIGDWAARYPGGVNQDSAVEISAPEVGGFASAIVAIGNGELSSDTDVNTAIIDFESDSTATALYGYCERVFQESSIVGADVLETRALTELDNAKTLQWRPDITLIGRQIAPVPTGEKKIWIGDVITVRNDEDLTGMTNGKFRVNELEVSVSSANGERIRPRLDADDINIAG